MTTAATNSVPLVDHIIGSDPGDLVASGVPDELVKFRDGIFSLPCPEHCEDTCFFQRKFTKRTLNQPNPTLHTCVHTKGQTDLRKQKTPQSIYTILNQGQEWRKLSTEIEFSLSK